MCDHREFKANVAVTRLEDIGRFMADISIECVECGERFRFIGVQGGILFDQPGVNIDGTELSVPIAPQSQVDSELEGTPMGFTMRKA